MLLLLVDNLKFFIVFGLRAKLKVVGKQIRTYSQYGNRSPSRYF